MRKIALDVGDSRIGIALSDPIGILAKPHCIIERRSDAEDISTILKLVDQFQVGQIIIGLPVSLDGRIGTQADKVRAFTSHLVKHTDIPVAFRDERMTTVSARRIMRETRGKKTMQTAKDDAVAAAVLLQGYLDEEAGNSRPASDF